MFASGVEWKLDAVSAKSISMKVSSGPICRIASSIALFAAWGLVDLQRKLSEAPGLYTFWDYGVRCFERDRGLRLDLMLGMRAVAERCRELRVDRAERAARPDSKPSDHAPVIATLDG